MWKRSVKSRRNFRETLKITHLRKFVLSWNLNLHKKFLLLFSKNELKSSEIYIFFSQKLLTKKFSNNLWPCKTFSRENFSVNKVLHVFNLQYRQTIDNTFCIGPWNIHFKQQRDFQYIRQRFGNTLLFRVRVPTTDIDPVV